MLNAIGKSEKENQPPAVNDPDIRAQLKKNMDKLMNAVGAPSPVSERPYENEIDIIQRSARTR